MLEALFWLTLNIYHEARSDDQISQIAIGHVVMNRAVKKHISVKDVIFEPFQFSWTFLIEDWVPHEERALEECDDSARIAWEGQDFTLGATHYHRTDTIPEWTNRMTYLDTYGSHAFYREK